MANLLAVLVGGDVVSIGVLGQDVLMGPGAARGDDGGGGGDAPRGARLYGRRALPLVLFLVVKVR